MSHMEMMQGVANDNVAFIVQGYKAEGALAVTVFPDGANTSTIMTTWADVPLSETAKTAGASVGKVTTSIVGDTSTPPIAAAHNTTVSTSTTYSDIKQEYIDLFKQMQILPEKLALINQQVDRIAKGKPRYQEFVGSLAKPIPWYVVALIHSMEAASDVGVFQAHLYNGDPLTARTVHYPPNCPPASAGDPPFTWEVSAKGALNREGFLDQTDWSLPHLLYLLEGYNGFGPRKYHQSATAYLWSYSNLYAMGKYVADNQWSDTAVSAQPGVATLLKGAIIRGVVDGAQTLSA